MSAHSQTSLPALDDLVLAADAGVHPWVRQNVPNERRREALAQEIGFWLNTAACDLGWAAGFAAHAPQLGLPAEAYLNRWLPIDTGAHVLAGPRYLGRDPDLPFVGIDGSDRPLTAADRDALVQLARKEFAPFGPKFVLLFSSEPVDTWPGCSTEKRTVVGSLAHLRTQPVAAALTARTRRDLDQYAAYQAIYDRDQAVSPQRRRWATAEDRASLQTLADQGLLFDVLVDDEWAGVIAAEPGARDGIAGPVVQELVLDHRYRGRGVGSHLSALLAQALPFPDSDLLVGTIHADNRSAYRSALRAGRVDVGGEIIIPV